MSMEGGAPWRGTVAGAMRKPARVEPFVQTTAATGKCLASVARSTSKLMGLGM
jgi:hypothetical protein